MNSSHSRFRRALPFLPAAVTFALAVIAPFVWVLWMRPPPSTFRMVLGKGVVLANWGGNQTRIPAWGLGHVDWSLGSGLMLADGTSIPFHASLLPRPTMNWDVEIHPGHVKIPLPYVATILAAWPSFSAWRRSRIKPSWACQKCGYDLRASSSTVCSECGTPAPVLTDSAAASPSGTA